jgi:hypothetical protein
VKGSGAFPVYKEPAAAVELVVPAAFSASFVSFYSFSPLVRHFLAAAFFAAASSKRQHAVGSVPQDEEIERARFRGNGDSGLSVRFACSLGNPGAVWFVCCLL